MLVITADHGMKPKSQEDGSPNAIFLQDHLDNVFLKGSTKVILPITDPLRSSSWGLRFICNNLCRR